MVLMPEYCETRLKIQNNFLNGLLQLQSIFRPEYL